ncbi:MAG: quinolinate synthase NadA [Candidatus Omnitrophica bacterium]|nr:quinolinate synthase NadA [Candidatus Omnitrophota bacterium]
MNSLVEKIERLKKEKEAIILAHNYQLPEVQDIADFLGDSLGLSIKAAETSAKMIVFCGVYFMAETAKILSPDKTVLIPDKDAGCPMADMITASQLKKLRQNYPQAKILSYVNTPAEVKAESDFACTSANAVKMVNSALRDEEEIIFVPDKYLASYVTSQTGKKFILWEGYCPSHIKISAKDILNKKRIYPQAEVLIHPECREEAINLADKVLSTEGMCRYVKSSSGKEFIIGTEPEIIHRLKKEYPDKEFYPASEEAVCPGMKRINLEKVLWSLENEEYKIELPPEIIKKARLSIERMINCTD